MHMQKEKNRKYQDFSFTNIKKNKKGKKKSTFVNVWYDQLLLVFSVAPLYHPEPNNNKNSTRFYVACFGRDEVNFNH